MKTFQESRSAVFRASLCFFILSAFWIVLSDQTLNLLVPDPIQSAWFHIYIGLAYVLAASVFLHRLLQREVVSRQRAEAELERSQVESRELAQRVGDIVFSVTPDTVVRFLNSAFTGLTGWACSDWVGKPFAGLLHPADLPLAMEKFTAVLRGETVVALELRIMSKDRGAILFELTVTPQVRQGLVEKRRSVLGET